MKESACSISRLLEKFPRAELIRTPAPIHKLVRLSAQLGYNIYILRDDLTGFALGGNKTRKLDYLVGDALANRADTLVTMKASSFSRNAAAAGSACGLDVHVVLDGDEARQNPMSQAFFEQCGTTLHYVVDDRENALAEACAGLVKALQAQGRAVYELHPGGSDSIGALGYLEAFREILDYSRFSGIHFSDMIHSTGSTGTQAGLVLGQCATGYDTQIVGVAASQKTAVQVPRVRELAAVTAQMLGIQLDATKILVDDRFIGPGYAIPSQEGDNAVKLFASLEGILLDQVYTGKAAAALLDYAENRRFKSDNVLFIHTGGNSGLFY